MTNRKLGVLIRRANALIEKSNKLDRQFIAFQDRNLREEGIIIDRIGDVLEELTKIIEAAMEEK